mmetsp:Transcript_11656/g.28313  ORF Transcript_11656/g.28313 Transcript_11656/m.28313 type:complete len:121 (-) Transcript_11656:438-800(-)
MIILILIIVGIVLAVFCLCCLPFYCGCLTCEDEKERRRNRRRREHEYYSSGEESARSARGGGGAYGGGGGWEYGGGGVGMNQSLAGRGLPPAPVIYQPPPTSYRKENMQGFQYQSEEGRQ